MSAKRRRDGGASAKDIFFAATVRYRRSSPEGWPTLQLRRKTPI